ncbi:hypothetical protein LZK98_11570 [Sphingomonas cannabina]|uniref:hypothetical protein n=1 Tax=Sphingomonas cannabina TaxID=2899123 RepID=UPI001F43E784|nr:hypothetical protein [Sphingomonas cannabina]UIJ43729.1 hypothetical protein LZK98_11570 [Sphingomonas cannabina]
MAVDLTGLKIGGGSQPVPVDFGGTLTPALGGPVQHIDRVGSRWSWQIVTPTMHEEPDGRIWRARLHKAQKTTGLILIPEPDLVIGNPGAPVVATNIAAGRLLAISGLTAGFVIPEGKWLSLIVNGQRYADKVEEQVTASAGGTATVTLRNLLRVPLAGGETVELAAPKLEGSISPDIGGVIDDNRHTSFSFTITEDA